LTRTFSRPARLAAIALALATVSCSFPTDKSNEVHVTLRSPAHVLLRGKDMDVYAQAWRVVGTDTQVIANVDFTFATGSASIARVEKTCCGYATVTGVNRGNVDIVARAVAFQDAEPADLVLRVSNPLEVDSVRPRVAHHGEVITLYGVGVDSLFIASLSGVNLIEYPLSRRRDSTGIGRISFWVPPPARSDSLFFLGAGVFGFDTARTNVIFQDVYEPNDTVSTKIDLDAPGPWPGTILAPIIFTNPALAFEPVTRSKSGEDWFRFATSDTTQALTFFITYPSFGDTSGTRIFLVDSLYYLANGNPALDPIEKFVGRDSADFLGSAFYRCKGQVFRPAQAPRESTTIALRSLPSHALHVLTNFTRPRRYGLTVAQGYFTADSRVKPDAYEENDMCHYADFGNRRISLTTTFADTLTIDNPHEVDWLRIDLPGSGPDSVRFRTNPRPLPGAGPDTSDIDLYVLRTPNPATATPLTLVALDTTRGSVSNVMARVTAGSSYYVAVVDFAGAPTRYSLCMARGLSVCTPIPAAPLTPTPRATSPAPSPTARRAAVPRRGPIVEPPPASRAVFRRPASGP
jgi:hypothetical protein